MKHLFRSALRRGRKTLALLQTTKNPLIPGTAFIFTLVMTSCQKDVSAPSVAEEFSTASSSSQKGINGFGNYTGLGAQTAWELQQAKIATARYNNFDNALADDYVDINVVVPEMGYHFLKVSNLDGTFDYSKPEILVYNKDENGRMKLVAVEYATPLTQTAPAGFTGDNDHWGIYQNTLWTLHAWIWEYNPAGVFNSTNPLIHLH